MKRISSRSGWQMKGGSAARRDCSRCEPSAVGRDSVEPGAGRSAGKPPSRSSHRRSYGPPARRGRSARSASTSTSRTTFVLLLLALVLTAASSALAAPAATNAASAHHALVVAPCSVPVAAGTATLTIGTLQRTGDVYGGTYQMKVSPYYFKSEKGRLAIVVPEEALAKIRQGRSATVTGTATAIGKSGRVRHVDAIATPTDQKQGKLKLWFMAKDRMMIFEPAYHFAEAGTAAVLTPTTETNLASNLKIHVPASPREFLAADAQRP